MKDIYKVLIIIGLTLAAAIYTASLHRIPQDASYHNFADGRSFLGINNFWNVVSNLPFLIIGFSGVFFVIKKDNRNVFKSPGDRFLWICVFAGIGCVGLGSAYYHLSPSNITLVWDRLPMTIVFMSFTAVIISERISSDPGWLFLVALNGLGVYSVRYWQHSEMIGEGDLRLYAFVQFAPMIILPAILLLYRKGPALFPDLAGVFLFYVAAKLAEHYDAAIYKFMGFVSGHTIKHFAASMAVFYMLKILVRRKKVTFSVESIN